MRINPPESRQTAEASSKTTDDMRTRHDNQRRGGEANSPASEVRLSPKGSQMSAYMKAMRALPETRDDLIDQARVRLTEQPLSSLALADALLGRRIR